MVQRSSLRFTWLCALALCHCKGSGEPAGVVGVSPSSTFSATPTATPSASAVEHAEWERVTDDPVDLAALGRKIGARRCVTEVVSGGEHGGEALQVLPFTPDAESQLGTLCDTLPGASEPQKTARLRAVAESLARGASDREVSDAPGLRRCAAVLKAEQTGSKGQDRDYIESSLEQLATRHVGVR